MTATQKVGATVQCGRVTSRAICAVRSSRRRCHSISCRRVGAPPLPRRISAARCSDSVSSSSVMFFKSSVMAAFPSRGCTMAKRARFIKRPATSACRATIFPRSSAGQPAAAGHCKHRQCPTRGHDISARSSSAPRAGAAIRGVRRSTPDIDCDLPNRTRLLARGELPSHAARPGDGRPAVFCGSEVRRCGRSEVQKGAT